MSTQMQEIKGPGPQPWVINCSTYWNLVNSFASHPSLPLMREVDSPLGEDGGRDDYPSVKNL